MTDNVVAPQHRFEHACDACGAVVRTDTPTVPRGWYDLTARHLGAVAYFKACSLDCVLAFPRQRIAGMEGGIGG